PDDRLPAAARAAAPERQPAARRRRGPAARAPRARPRVVRGRTRRDARDRRPDRRRQDDTPARADAADRGAAGDRVPRRPGRDGDPARRAAGRGRRRAAGVVPVQPLARRERRVRTAGRAARGDRTRRRDGAARRRPGATPERSRHGRRGTRGAAQRWAAAAHGARARRAARPDDPPARRHAVGRRHGDRRSDPEGAAADDVGADDDRRRASRRDGPARRRDPRARRRAGRRTRPARGPARARRALRFAVAPPGVRGLSAPRTSWWRRLAEIVRPQRGWIAASLALLLVAAGARLLQPWLVKLVIDRHLVTGRMSGFAWLVAGFAGAAGTEWAARRGQMLTLERAGQNALLDLRRRVFDHLQRLPIAWYDRTPTGRIVGRVTTDIESLQEMFSSG